MFDSWGGVLADGAFQAFSLAYTGRVLQQLKREHDGQRIPRIVFTKGGGLWLEEIAALGADVRRRRLDGQPRRGARARRRPASRCRATSIRTCCSPPPAAIAAEVARCWTASAAAAAAAPSGHVFNLGHGISQHTPPEQRGGAGRRGARAFAQYRAAPKA